MAFKSRFFVTVTKQPITGGSVYRVTPSNNLAWTHTIKPGEEDYEPAEKALRGKGSRQFHAQMVIEADGTYVAILWDQPT